MLSEAFVAVASLLVLVSGASTWPRVEPDHRQIQVNDSHTLVCRFNAPLDDCRLRVWWDAVNTSFDFRRGVDSAQQDIISSDDVRARASYAGGGLGVGECGVTLTGVKKGGYLLQCAGRLRGNGSWGEGFGLLYAVDKPLLPARSTSPALILAAPGSDVTVRIQVGTGIVGYCDIHTPSAKGLTAWPTWTPPKESRYQFLGTEMHRGRCGWTLKGVSQGDAGQWHWRLRRGGAYADRLALLAVLAAPDGGPHLHVRDPTKLRAGDVVEATCSAPPSVPVSTLVWLLDGVVVREDAAQETVDGETEGWTLPWQPRAARQTLRRRLKEGDVGKRLECRVQHAAAAGARVEGVVLGARCGVRAVPGATRLSVGGHEAGFGEFPWHVAVFKADAVLGAGNAPRKLVACGATIVAPTFLVSAAHCFWDFQQRKPTDPARYRVIAGKHSPNWDQLEPNEQRRSLKRVHLPVSFAGERKHLESDIAVVELTTPLEMTPTVAAVCMDWSHTARAANYAMPGSVGTVPGWGLTESGTQSTALRFVDLQFVALPACLHAVPTDYQVYLTLDKMCGGYVNHSTSVCRGDSGGGYIFEEADAAGRLRYVLRGVVSSSSFVRSGCQAQYPSAFTSVAAHAEWLYDVMVGGQESGVGR